MVMAGTQPPQGRLPMKGRGGSAGWVVCSGMGWRAGQRSEADEEEEEDVVVVVVVVVVTVVVVVVVRRQLVRSPGRQARVLTRPAVVWVPTEPLAPLTRAWAGALGLLMGGHMLVVVWLWGLGGERAREAQSRATRAWSQRYKGTRRSKKGGQRGRTRAVQLGRGGVAENKIWERARVV